MNVKTTAQWRDLHLLHVHRDTLQCAFNRCIACCYKIVLYSRPGLLPNVRPEMCLRMAKAKAQSLTEISTYWIGLYDAVQVKRILTVGDGNFSFSLSLARSLCPESGVQLVVTSHESKTTVLETYPDGEKILDELNAMSNVTVKHEVDATDAEMIKTLGHFDRVIWNFPCVRAPRGEDGQNEAMEMNKKLLHEFFSHVGQVLTSCGEVHVTHKTKAPFGQWGIDNIAKTNKFYHKLSVVFDRCLYPGYTNKKVLSKGSFPIWDSQTFIFVPEERTQVPADVAIPDNEKSDIRLIEIVTMDILKKVYILLTPSLDETLGSRKKRGGFSDKGGRSSNSYKDVIRNRTDSRKDQKRKRLASDGLNGCKQLGKKKGRRS
ncbi:unnamed protein product [Peronospora belbahrii]|uniref:25S rRNA (uridine-N(3))-methyltransferase BMT5-like domain-containing protein n=1 Tax=Peronospora belbahrii TaxID=622444 RepID=A0AAU9KRU3_9STRA|nr:unnamed protein product [Peronospora belbahrii]